MILGALGLILGNAAVCVAARSLLRRVASGRPATDLVIFLLIRATLISGVVLLAGLTQFLSAGPLTLLSGVALAGLLAFRSNRALPRLPELNCGRPALILAGVLALRLLLQVWFFAPYNVDPQSYHLPKIAEWVSAGGFTRELGGDARSWFPAGFELIETWWAVFLHHDVLIEMAGVEFLALAAAATYALARELGLESRPASWAALLVAMMPGLHLQATACTNDLVVTALWVSTTALLTARAPIGLLLLAAGLGIGVKGTYLYALPGLAVWAWLLHREKKESSWKAGYWGCGAGAAALAVGLFWYVRNVVVWHNPVYPMGTAKVDVGGVPLQPLGFSLERLSLNLGFLLDPALLDAGHPHGPLLVHAAGWGAAIVACGLPSLLVLLIEEPRWRKLSACFAVSLISVFSLVAFDGIGQRFVLFFPVLLALGAAVVIPRIPGATWVLVAALAFQFVGTSLPGEIGRSGIRDLARQGWRDRGRPQDLPEGVPGCLIGHDARAYRLYGPDFSRRPVYLHGETADEILRELERGRVEWLYEFGTPVRVKESLEECVRRGRLRKLRTGLYLVLEKT